MAYVITDINDFEFTIDDGFRLITVWKQNVRFGDIVGDVLTLYWHNKAQTDTQYELDIDYNDVTTPVVASAADLQTALEGMISSGWAPTPEDEFFTITLNHGNHSPNDVTPNYFGWRIGLPAEPAKNSNPAVVPMDCTIVRADMSWRAATGASAEVIDFYISVWSSVAVPVLQSDTIAIQHDLSVNAATGSNNWASSGVLAISASAGQLIWAHYVGPWATNPVNVTITMLLTCKKT